MKWQMKTECGALVRGTGGFNGAFVKFQYLFCDRKAESRAVRPVILFDAIKPVKNVGEFLLGDPASGI